jgi:hypothetical protein
LINGCDMGRGVSSFYPPRARWYSPLLAIIEKLRRRLALDGLHLPAGISAGAVLVSLAVPGAGVYCRAPRFWGRVILASCALLLLVFVIWFGYPAATIAFGMLLSIHTCGLVYLFEPLILGESLRARLLIGLAAMIALSCLLYLPGRAFVQDHWFLPLRLNGRVIVVSRSAPSVALRRGEWVAYSFESTGDHGLIVHEGMGLSQLLALPGDTVRFAESTFDVNGLSQPRLHLMPTAGEYVIPEKHWFVWPKLAISGHGEVPVTEVAQTLMSLGTLSEDRFLGTAPRRWMWRQQF